jgi:hypothetical protein
VRGTQQRPRKSIQTSPRRVHVTTVYVPFTKITGTNSNAYNQPLLSLCSQVPQAQHVRSPANVQLMFQLHFWCEQRRVWKRNCVALHSIPKLKHEYRHIPTIHCLMRLDRLIRYSHEIQRHSSYGWIVQGLTVI